MSARVRGRLVSYNATKMYGFLRPDDGGEDVFVHARDVDYPLRDADLGSRFEFEVVPSDRGAKAIRMLADSGGTVREDLELADDEWEPVAREDYSREITDALIAVAPDLTGSQIQRIRQLLLTRAESRNWVDR